ncbi:hypothetical protein OAF52_01885 [bacterium]|nr:hypothetical protein [bacterium]
MKTRKAKSKTKVETTKYGKVSVLTTTHIGEAWKNRYQTVCRRKSIPQHLQRVDWHTFTDAVNFANELDLAIRTGQYKQLLQDENKELNEIAERIKTEKLLANAEETHAMSQYKSKPKWAEFLGRETTLTDLFDAGKQAVEISSKVNEARWKAGLKEWSVLEFFKKFESTCMSYAQKMKRPKFKEMIDLRLHFLCGKNGGKGRRELEKSSKKEWKEKLTYLSEWVGDFSVGEEPETLINKIKKGIDSAISKSGKNKGSSWSATTREKQAKKISQFGAWLLKEKKRTGWEENYFNELQNDYVNADPKGRAATLSAEQIERIFKIAMRKENRKLIPYITFLFFATTRPQEVADPNNSKRRLKWKWMDNWEIDSEVTGGKLFEIPAFEKGIRKSKINKDRQADLTENGLKWMEWWAKEEGVNLPTSGTIYYYKELWADIRKEANVFDNWEQDVARHTLASNCHHNTKFKHNYINYWMDSFGHDRKTYNRHYKAVRNPNEVKRFFGITPESPVFKP